MAQSYLDLLNMQQQQNPANAAGASISSQFQNSPYYKDNFDTLGKTVPGYQTSVKMTPGSAQSRVLGRNSQGRHPFEYMASKGLDPADPQTYARVREALLGPQAKNFGAQYWVTGDNKIKNYMKYAPPAMRDAYVKSRYTYDNGLRGGFGDELSNYNGRHQAEKWDDVVGPGN
jgi:hypothetical protein